MDLTQLDEVQRKTYLLSADNAFLDHLISNMKHLPKGEYSRDDRRDLKSYKPYFDIVRDDRINRDTKRQIIKYYVYKFIHIIKQGEKLPEKKVVRNRRDCPIPECQALGLSKLSNHLFQVHELSDDERRHWLYKARHP